MAADSLPDGYRRAEYGMVHGRFQPFHNEHRHYALEGLARSERLIVGITNPDPGEIKEEAASGHRHLAENNPYTYFERMEMVLAALTEAGADLDRVRVIPFHISEPAKWRYYLPPAGKLRHFVRIFSPWEQSKVDRLRAEGYEVEVLDPGAEKGIEATEIRRRMAAGDDSWENLVPPAVVRILARIHAPTG